MSVPVPSSLPALGMVSLFHSGRSNKRVAIPCCCSVAQLWLTLCNSMDCCTPDFPVLHHLPVLAQTHVHWIGDAIQLFHPLSLFFSLQSFPASGLFAMGRLFPSSGQSIGALSSASVLPLSIQGWFPLRLTDLISLLSKGLYHSFNLHFPKD